jgi:hypothetical protein
MARLFDCDYNISNLVICLSTNVLVDVIGGMVDDLAISFDIGIGLEVNDMMDFLHLP